MKRSLINVLAPPAPACFSARDIWVGYLESTQNDKCASQRPFIRIRVVEQAHMAWNESFNHCRDCIEAHRDDMQRVGRCKPHRDEPVKPQPIRLEMSK